MLLALGAGCRSRSSADAGAPALSREWLEGLPVADTATPVDGGTLTVRALAEPGGLDLLDDRYRDAWSFRITRNTVFESLLEIDPTTYRLKPQLAESFDESDDHLTHVFHLRDDVRFHDGAQFTAADVVAVFDTMRKPERPSSSLRADFVDLASYRATDAHTVELKWKTVSPFHLRAVAKLPMQRGTDARAPVGTGPFKLAQWESGQRLVLTRAETHRGPQPFLDRVVFRFVKDQTVAAQLFEKGEFDLMTFILPTLWRGLETPTPQNAWVQRGYRRLKSIDNSYSFIAWNEAVPPFADVRVRRALAQLYPAEQLAKNVDLGLEVPTTCPYWLGSGQCDPTVKPLPFDPAAARAALADAGVTEASFSLLIPSTSVRLQKLAPMLKEQLATAGITMTIDGVDSAVLNQRVTRRELDAVSRVWTELDAEADAFQIFHSSQIDGGSNYAGYRSDEADRLLEQIRVELDDAKRLALQHALHRRLYEDQPYLFMTARQSLDAAKTKVHGLQPSLLWYDLRRVWISQAP